MNLVMVPFHDYRKCEHEGFRTRDGHFIQHFLEHPEIEKLVIVNRPFTPLELLYKRTGRSIKGKVVAKNAQFQIVQIHPKAYVLDFQSLDMAGQVLQKKAWYWKGYASKQFQKAIGRALELLQVKEFSCLVQTLYGAPFSAGLGAKRLVFDAFDDWRRIPAYASMYPQIEQSYDLMAEKADLWVTNSEENLVNYKERHGMRSGELIRNGVDRERFEKPLPSPEDLKNIRGPIIGFGGKITHLIHVEMLNRVVEDHPDKSFVVLGQVLDKGVFQQMGNYPNLHYLGDKPYEDYPAYVVNFDVCMIPYHTGDKAHGGDSIKFYEFLAAKKPVVSTEGNGIRAIGENVYLANETEAFSQNISRALERGWQVYEIPEEMTWKHKVNTLVGYLKTGNN